MTDNPFEKVLDRLREFGWIKGRYHKDEASCLLGASIHTSTTRWFTNNDISDNSLIKAIIDAEYPDRVEPDTQVVSFNDHPDTTFADVERVLEKAAVKWEEERVMRDE